MRKNFVTFTYGKYGDIVAFVAHPRCYEIIVVQQDFSASPDFQLCCEVREMIEKSLYDVTVNSGTILDSNHMEKLCRRYEIAFDCPIHPEENHLCLIPKSEKSPVIMKCEVTNDPVPLKKQQQVWFCQVRILLIKLCTVESVDYHRIQSVVIPCH